MIRMTFIINEEDTGVVRFMGASEDLGGNPTNKEVEFAENLMKQISRDNFGTFEKVGENVPLTIIKTSRKTNEHPDRR